MEPCLEPAALNVMLNWVKYLWPQVTQRSASLPKRCQVSWGEKDQAQHKNGAGKNFASDYILVNHSSHFLTHNFTDAHTKLPESGLQH